MQDACQAGMPYMSGGHASASTRTGTGNGYLGSAT